MSEKVSTLSQLGEFGLISYLNEKYGAIGNDTIKGIGDDAAVINAGEELILLSTDIMIEGIHFDLSYMPLPHLGYKAVATNVSDIAAMNGKPKHILISLGLSSKFSVEAIDALYKGIQSACKDYKIDLIGGDTSSSRTGLIINITVVGTSKLDEVVYRSGAQKGDIVCVSGDLGAAYTGLQLLEREKQVFLSNPNNQPKLDDKAYVVQRQLKPNARMDVIHELKSLGVKPTAMIDISDGLASELFHICKSSKLGVNIYEDKLPFDPMVEDIANEFGLSLNTCILNGGEDYELLFTIQQDDYAKIKNHPDITTIGYMTAQEEGVNLISSLNQKVPLSAQGWNHFSK